MENDLIRRSDVLDLSYTHDTHDGWGIEAVDKESIMSIPAVDAVEVRHGRWEGDYPQATFRLKRCSVCETLAPEGWYCFFCGAKMDGRREDGKDNAE